jgi:GH25 family lysozyme M1 (1,4-beta-N-acetylmuramidase)
MKRVPVSGPVTLCYDVSHWQQDLHLHAHMRLLGAKVCMIKATESLAIQDDMFRKHVAEAKTQGMIVGFYHFNRANRDPIAQARNYEQVIGSLGQNDLGPILDLETFDGLDIPHVRDEALTIIRELHSHFGRTVVLYGGPSKLESLNLPPEVARLCVLWVAHYGPQPSTGPLVPAPFNKWAFWQFTDGKVGFSKGGAFIKCDFSYFWGELTDLKSVG